MTMVSSYGFSVGDKVILIKNTPIAVEGHIDFIKGILQTNDAYEIELKGIPGRFVYDFEIELLEHAKKEECPVEEGDICLVNEYLEALGHKEICILSVDKNKGRMQFCKWPMEEHWQHNVYQASVNDVAMVLFNRFESVELGKGEEVGVPKEQSALDVQIGGEHYKSKGIQPIEYAHANNLGFMEANIVKYVSRHQDKHGAEDIRKAIHYCKFILELKYGIKE